MALTYPPGLADRIAKVLSEILPDKYGDEYECKITLRRVNKEEMEGIEDAVSVR